MPQVKKKEIHEAIIRSATKLFSEQGYHATKLAAIAAGADLGVGSIYSYFPSKLHLLYELYRPWFQAWLSDIEGQVRAIAEPRAKLRRLIVGLWHDFPAGNPGLANSLMEALASNDAYSGKPNDLLKWTEQRLADMLRDILPPDRAIWLDNNVLPHILLMAQDGFIINYRWGDIRDTDAVVETMTDALLGLPRVN